jgi:peptidoglycan-associated lipoprotein
MKFASQKLCFVFASAALVLAGCSKKPDRPTPTQTVMGPQTGGPGFVTNTGPSGVDFGPSGLGGPREVLGPENPEILKAQTVYFDFDRSDIKPAERVKLKAAKDHLDKNPTHRLVLEGRADWRGTAEYNLSLGDRRANAAKKYLQTLGVAAERLETRSKGSLEAAKNADEGTMAKDRRVDLIVVDPARAMPSPL